MQNEAEEDQGQGYGAAYEGQRPRQVQDAVIYQELRFWSATLGGNACRLSLVDGRGAEFFAIVPRDVSARAWRERKQKALEAIEDAIALGAEPGEIFVAQVTEA